MAKQDEKARKKSVESYEQRKVRRQQIIFGILAAIIIITWIISMVLAV